MPQWDFLEQVGCHRKWHELDEISGSSTIRFCSECQKNVQWVKDLSTALSLGSQGLCVAVAAPHSVSRLFVGDIILLRDLRELSLTTEVLKSLQDRHLYYIEDLVRHTENELQHLLGLDQETIIEILEALSKCGRTLRAECEPQVGVQFPTQ